MPGARFPAGLVMGFSVRPGSFVRLLLLICGLFPAVAAAQTGAAPPRPQEARGIAQPSEEAWGDEWYDEAAAAGAKEIEAKMVQEASGAKEPSAPAPAPAASPQPRAERHFSPPAHGPDDIVAAWRDRRDALLRQDLQTARDAEGRVRQLLLELDVPEVHSFAGATLRESRKLESSAPAEAEARAALAAALAPSLPAVHLQRMRAHFASSPADLPGLARFAADALAAQLHNPRSFRRLVVDVAAAGAAALVGAGALLLLFLLAAHCRASLHDFHHLFPRSLSRLQTGLLAALILALPLALGFGPLPFVALLVSAVWFHVTRGERALLGAWLALLSLLPAGARLLALETAWDGTPAAALFAVDRGGDFSALPELEARVRRGEADAPTTFVVARAWKRQGRLDEARSLYEAALAARPRWPEAAVNLGNVRFLEGDLEGAEQLYAKAIDWDPSVAAAYFNLSRVHYDKANISLGQAARARAIELRPALARRYAAGDKGGAPANQYLVDLQLSDEDLQEAASKSPEPVRLEAELTEMFLGPVPPSAAPFAGAGVALVLGGMLFLVGRIRPARGCSRCGRPVCASCDPETAGGTLCGQCTWVFGMRGAVDPTLRRQKEGQVRRHEGRRLLWRRLGTLFLAGPLLAGRWGRGTALLVFGLFVAALALLPDATIRPIYEGWPLGLRLAAMTPPLLGAWILAFRDERKEG